jgi:hypothetical protein
MAQMDADPDLGAIRTDPPYRALLPTPQDFANPFVEPVQIVREWDGESTGDQFGWIARTIGDVDRDGVVDIVTSAPTKDIGGASAGRVYVYSTKTGKESWHADGRPGDQLGTGLEAAGDVNHDGYADIIVGAPGSNAGGDAAGRAYVYSGKDGQPLLTLTGESAGDKFGSAVAGHGDAHGFVLIVGAPSAGSGRHGRTYVYITLSAKPQFVIDSDETGNALGGMFVSAVGDVNHDGIRDVYASDFSNTAKGPSTGRIYVRSGKGGAPLLTLIGETAGEGFGTSPSSAGDVDGDGYDDLIVGAWQYAGVAISGGRVYLYSGKGGRLMKTFTCRTPGDTFGFDAVGLGDVDGDGTADLLITSGWSGVHGFHSGRVFIVSSGVMRRSGPTKARTRTRAETRR